ncbi:hypothetical protein NKH77_18245 [Streptomyces sp. M19]
MLDATYYDTRGSGSRRTDHPAPPHRRRRRGWHLKLPAGPDARDEVHAPLADTRRGGSPGWSAPVPAGAGWSRWSGCGRNVRSPSCSTPTAACSRRSPSTGSPPGGWPRSGANRSAGPRSRWS